MSEQKPMAANRQVRHKYHEYGWLIEGAWSHVQTPDYWIGSSAWSTDHERALRFARKQDAEQAAAMMLDGVRVRICEHVWTIDRTDTKRGKRSRPANPNTQDLPLAADSAKGCGDRLPANEGASDTGSRK